MIVRFFEVPLSPANVIELSGLSQTTWSGIFMQAPEANKQLIFFGDPSNQKFELRPERSAFVPITQAKSLHVYTTKAGNFLTVGFL